MSWNCIYLFKDNAELQVFKIVMGITGISANSVSLSSLTEQSFSSMVHTCSVVQLVMSDWEKKQADWTSKIVIMFSNQLADAFKLLDYISRLRKIVDTCLEGSNKTDWTNGGLTNGGLCSVVVLTSAVRLWADLTVFSQKYLWRILKYQKTNRSASNM